MKLQVAIDDVSYEEALDIVRDLHPYLDIIEVGTPMIIKYGLKLVSEIRKKHPNIEILADCKIMDGGALETEMSLKAGADIVTVMGITDDSTIKDSIQVAHKFGKKIMVDMLCVNNVKVRATELERMGADILSIHTGVDQQSSGKNSLKGLIELKEVISSSKVAVAGGINLKTLSEYKVLSPDIIIVGGGIIKANDRISECQKIYESIKGITNEY
ncbi:3-hexulose-6-phosphate synthase [Falseniella ignava]|uniref:3-hexulose-6-phosphate synthase n=1 Tax=Falseniella ignava CCUG 37419 TaxID=883112 RepID=K1MIU8_9LACT|nr:3-hexulose-6-phosphate synthase [Falseniella ignava]EKB55789.1 3-hexulose-6-phosphate synthase [Falseniella ignava CCUG 37419]